MVDKEIFLITSEFAKDELMLEISKKWLAGAVKMWRSDSNASLMREESRVLSCWSVYQNKKRSWTKKKNTWQAKKMLSFVATRQCWKTWDFGVQNQALIAKTNHKAFFCKKPPQEKLNKMGNQIWWDQFFNCSFISMGQTDGAKETPSHRFRCQQSRGWAISFFNHFSARKAIMLQGFTWSIREW